MKQTLYFLWYFMNDNPGRAILLTTFTLSVIFLCRSKIETVEQDIVTRFEHDHKEYFITHTGKNSNQDNKYNIKEIDNDTVADFENMIYKSSEVSFGQILSFILGSISIIIFLVSCFNTYEYPWGVARCRAKAGIHSIEAFEENGTFYYKYNGKLLCTHKGALDERDINNELYSFHKSKGNLYPDFEAPTKKLRNIRIQDILSDKS